MYVPLPNLNKMHFARGFASSCDFLLLLTVFSTFKSVFLFLSFLLFCWVPFVLLSHHLSFLGHLSKMPKAARPNKINRSTSTITCILFFVVIFFFCYFSFFVCVCVCVCAVFCVCCVCCMWLCGCIFSIPVPFSFPLPYLYSWRTRFLPPAHAVSSGRVQRRDVQPLGL
jgi:hypothetical protein